MYIRNLSLLFIDDERQFTQPIADYLQQQYGHRSNLVQSVELAQKELAKNPCDIIFLDYKLPGAGGIEFLKWTVEQKIETPVIMMTGKGAEEIAAEAMKLGAYDYVNKAHVTLDYVPFLINNTYERFVLRKAQRELETERFEREKREVAAATFQTTVRSFAHHINNQLTNILLRVQSQRRKLAKQKATVDPADLDATLGEVEQSTMVIEAVISSLVNLNKAANEKINMEVGVGVGVGIEKEVFDIKKALEEAIEKIETKRAQKSAKK